VQENRNGGIKMVNKHNLKGKSGLNVVLVIVLMSMLIVSTTGCIEKEGGIGKEAEDTVLPTVNILNPADDATINGTVIINVDASDNVGISKVEFYIDDTLKNTDTISPYEWNWDTTTYSNGTYTLKVIAYDESGNNNYHQITVNVMNEVVDEGPVYREEVEQFTASIEPPACAACKGNPHDWNVSTDAYKIIAVLTWDDTSWDLDFELGIGTDTENGTKKTSDTGGEKGDGEGIVTLIYEPGTELETGTWYVQVSTKEETGYLPGYKRPGEECEYTVEVTIYYLQ